MRTDECFRRPVISVQMPGRATMHPMLNAAVRSLDYASLHYLMAEHCCACSKEEPAVRGAAMASLASWSI